uniref:G-protein coupled receptors family 1 profile domain-containing protein n=1 Tax=Gadus morhua TaxID=8049 RepID=A0A8C5FJE1_GADMO
HRALKDSLTHRHAHTHKHTDANTEGYSDLLETSDGQLAGPPDGGPGPGEGWSSPYPLGFQVSLTAVLLLELVLGFSSNLTVLVLYCAQSNLVDSVSNLVTVNLHVLDILVCLLCLPLTVAVILLPADGGGSVGSLATLCCFHEACVTFTSVATAVNVLVISLDRYDISVRPASRLLTPRRAFVLLACVWAVSLAVFFLPFLEGDFFSSAEDGDAVQQNPYGYYTGLSMYYHLLLQVPCFFVSVAVMLFTYSRILQALNIRIGSHMMRATRATRSSDSGCRILGTTVTAITTAATTPTASTPAPPGSPGPASVSAIIALRRAVRRHRDRRERQRRVLKMSLIIISTSWLLGAAVGGQRAHPVPGPQRRPGGIRLCSWPWPTGPPSSTRCLYAFTRQKLRRALKTRVKKRVVSLLQVDPAPSGGGRHPQLLGGGRRAEEGAEAHQCLSAQTVEDVFFMP